MYISYIIKFVNALIFHIKIYWYLKMFVRIYIYYRFFPISNKTNKYLQGSVS